MISSKEKYRKDSTHSIWIERVTCSQLNLSPTQNDEYIHLIYVVSGCVNYTTEGKKSKCLSADDIILIYPGEQYAFSLPSSKQVEMIKCKFLPELIQHTYIADLGVSSVINSFDMQSLLSNKRMTDAPIKLEKNNAINIKEILLNMKEELDSKTYGSQSILWLRLIEVLILLSRKSNERKNPKMIKTPPTNPVDSEKVMLVKNINNYLLQYYNEKISTAVVANVFNISVRHLNRIYKQHTGFTVTEMIHQIRIDKAKHYLIHSGDKVINVAMKVGYDDPAFFSRLFRRKVGCSPGYYKKNNSKLMYSI